MGERMVLRNKMGMHPLEQPVSVRLRHADKPHAISQCCGLGDVGRDDVPDPADRDIAERRARAEGD